MPPSILSSIVLSISFLWCAALSQWHHRAVIKGKRVIRGRFFGGGGGNVNMRCGWSFTFLLSSVRLWYLPWQAERTYLPLPTDGACCELWYETVTQTHMALRRQLNLSLNLYFYGQLCYCSNCSCQAISGEMLKIRSQEAQLFIFLPHSTEPLWRSMFYLNKWLRLTFNFNKITVLGSKVYLICLQLLW